MTNGFELNHDTNLQIYFCEKCQAKNDFWRFSKPQQSYVIWSVFMYQHVSKQGPNEIKNLKTNIIPWFLLKPLKVAPWK